MEENPFERKVVSNSQWKVYKWFEKNSKENVYLKSDNKDDKNKNK